MPAPTVMGIFDSPDDAEKAREELLHAGVARHRIVVSGPLSDEELVVGENPDPESFGEALPRGACIVSVAARSHVDKKHIAELMLRYGARGTIEARP
jgi:hypothetical protein